MSLPKTEPYDLSPIWSIFSHSESRPPCAGSCTFHTIVNYKSLTRVKDSIGVKLLMFVVGNQGRLNTEVGKVLHSYFCPPML
ncbi:hypothetical protein HanRHA438_Chr15g0684331 [Helianthus annuus]|nr:hypothetical protein HanRHA438_Chr15g0684331 [Helianthus annuus]